MRTTRWLNKLIPFQLIHNINLTLCIIKRYQNEAPCIIKIEMGTNLFARKNIKRKKKGKIINGMMKDDGILWNVNQIFSEKLRYRTTILCIASTNSYRHKRMKKEKMHSLLCSLSWVSWTILKYFKRVICSAESIIVEITKITNRVTCNKAVTFLLGEESISLSPNCLWNFYRISPSTRFWIN